MTPSPIMQSFYEGRREDAARLAEGAGDGALDLFEAASIGRVTRIAEILSSEPQLVNARSDDGFTALHFAAFFGDLASAALLLRSGADVAAVADNEMRVQPLHSAVAAHRDDTAACLLACGADPNAKQQAGWTALHSAAEHGARALAELLVACGADPAASSDEGKTPSDLAAASDHADLAAWLRDQFSREGL